MTAVLDHTDAGFAAVMGARRGRPLRQSPGLLWLSRTEREQLSREDLHEHAGKVRKLLRPIGYKNKAGARTRTRTVERLNQWGPQMFGPLTDASQTGVADYGRSSVYPDAAQAVHDLVNVVAREVAAEQRPRVDALLGELAMDQPHIMTKHALTELDTSICKLLTLCPSKAFSAVRAGDLDLDVVADSFRERWLDAAAQALGGVMYRRREKMQAELGLPSLFSQERASNAARAYLACEDPAPGEAVSRALAALTARR